MKTINTLALGTLATLAAVFFQTSTARADNNGKADEENHGAATITFTKYVTAVLNQPGLIATMTGVGEGAAGDVLFEGIVLKQSAAPIRVEALYHFTGTKHSFSALIHGSQAVP